MVKEKIKYTNYNDEEVEEVFYFNINKIEYNDLNRSIPGGVERMMQTLVDNKDASGVVDVLRQFIEKAYGVKTVDGKRMIKGKEVLEEFTQSEAYVALLEKLVSNARYAAEFIAGILPIDKDTKEKAIAEAISAAENAEIENA